MPRQQKRAAERAKTKTTKAQTKEPAGPKIYKIEDLDKRQRAGVDLYERLAKEPNLRVVVGEERRAYRSRDDEDAYYFMERQLRNHRGVLDIKYTCFCSDQKKEARRDCLHRFCEKIIDGVVVIQGTMTDEQRAEAVAVRRPPRKRTAADGRDIRTTQRSARVRMPVEIPRLVMSLKNAWEAANPNAMAMRHGALTADAVRAAVLLLKIAEGRSADAMVARYQQLIDDHGLPLKRPPHQNSITEWMNDPVLTPILLDWLCRTSRPFRLREVAAIIDATKTSQLRTAHSRLIEYGPKDKRPGAVWLKANTLCGVETMIIMAVVFSTKAVHDSQFTLELVDMALKTFNIRLLLGDKAYLAEQILGELWKRAIKACIPVKSKWDAETKKFYLEIARNLVKWYDETPRKFDEIYRLRPKIEGLFSIIKRVAQGFCWSRGRARKDVAGKLHFDQQMTEDGPCVAWMNESLCKFIYMNLRTTVTLEEETGIDIDYQIESRFFPAPDKPLLLKDF
jgi:hypothetical protein